MFDAVGDVLPLAEWRFDEANWSAAGDVKDSRPNNYDGTAFVTTPDANTKQICRAADFTTTGTSDYIALDGQVLANQEISLSLPGCALIKLAARHYYRVQIMVHSMN